MEITFSNVRSKEIVNLYDGRRLGRAIDLVFDKESGQVLGLVVPSLKKLFKKNDDIFIPLANLKKIGEDVILVKLSPEEPEVKKEISERQKEEFKTYARYKRVPEKEK